LRLLRLGPVAAVFLAVLVEFVIVPLVLLAAVEAARALIRQFGGGRPSGSQEEPTCHSGLRRGRHR
jgi:hypothetical protein